MVEIRVFGKLRRYVTELEAEGGNLLKVTPQPQETLEQLLARIGIPLDDIYTIFLNSRISWPPSGAVSVLLGQSCSDLSKHFTMIQRSKILRFFRKKGGTH